METKQKELIELKYNTMINRINRLQNMYELLNKGWIIDSTSFEMLKNEYSKMYKLVISKGKYEKYKEVEDIVLKLIAKVELRIEEFIRLKQKKDDNYYGYFISSLFGTFRRNKNYQNYQNIDALLNKLETLKDILKIAKCYVTKNALNTIDNDFIKLKFDLLYRKHVEELIYNNGAEESFFVKCAQNNELKMFQEYLFQKMKELRSIELKDGEIEADLLTIKHDKIFKMRTANIINDSRMIERLIIFDIRKNYHEYIELLNAPIFNPYFCNISDTTDICFYDGIRYDLFRQFFKRKIISNDLISYNNCLSLFEKFGYKCNPIALNIGQECVKMIFYIKTQDKERLKMVERILKASKNLHYNYNSGNTENNSAEEQEEKIPQYFTLELNSTNLNIFHGAEEERNYFERLLLRRDFKPTTDAERKNRIESIKKKIKRGELLITDIDTLLEIANDILEKNTLSYESYIITEKKKSDDTLASAIGLLNQIHHLVELRELNGKYTSKFELEDLRHAIAYLYGENGMNITSCLVPLEDERTLTLTTSFVRIEDEVIKDMKHIGLDIKIIDINRILINANDLQEIPLNYDNIEILTKEEVDRLLAGEER